MSYTTWIPRRNSKKSQRFYQKTMQDLLCGSQVQVTSNDVIVGAQAIPGTNKNEEGLTPSVLPGTVVIGHSSEKPSDVDAILR